MQTFREWAKLENSLTGSAIAQWQWQRRLNDCMSAHEGHFERAVSAHACVDQIIAPCLCIILLNCLQK